MRCLLLYACFLSFLTAASQPALTEVQQSENLVRNGDFMARDPLQRPLNWTTGAGLQTAYSPRSNATEGNPMIVA